MTGPSSTERAAAQEGPKLPLVCRTCGDTYTSDPGNPIEKCQAQIKYLTCSRKSHHFVAFTPISDWLPGMPCPQSTYNCPGRLKDLGETDHCPGRLTPQV